MVSLPLPTSLYALGGISSLRVSASPAYDGRTLLTLMWSLWLSFDIHLAGELLLQQVCTGRVSYFFFCLLIFLCVVCSVLLCVCVFLFLFLYFLCVVCRELPRGPGENKMLDHILCCLRVDCSQQVVKLLQISGRGAPAIDEPHGEKAVRASL